MEGKQAVKEAKKFLDRVKPDLVIQRVPKKSLDLFHSLAREEFCNDFGFTLKFLLDHYFGLLMKGSERAEAMAAEALEKVAEINTSAEGNTIRTVDGKEKVIKNVEID